MATSLVGISCRFAHPHPWVVCKSWEEDKNTPKQNIPDPAVQRESVSRNGGKK